MIKNVLTTLALLFIHAVSNAQQEFGILDINNIRCNVSSTGDLFNRFDDPNLPGFEVPAGSGIHSINAANLWVAGRTQDQTLHLTAEMLQANGQDWFSGPLTTDGSATTNEATQLAYNHVWTANSADVERHILYFDLLNNGQSTLEDFPNGYTIPQWIIDWPAHGNSSEGQDFFLSPFYDFNQNGLYDPALGDYPEFCGEKCIYFIINDKGNIHTESGGLPIGLEIHGMLYGFNSTESDMLNNTVFVKYRLINRSSITLLDTYIGLWVDFQLGNFLDDQIASDVQNGGITVMNGDNDDESTSEVNGYGTDLGAQGVMLLQGPRADNDMLDNPLTTNIPDALANQGIPYAGCGLGYGDGITDDERLGQTNTMYMLNNSDPNQGIPTSGMHYFSYLTSHWKDGSSLTVGGSGFGSSDIPTTYVYPDNSDPLNWGTQGADVFSWAETIGPNTIGDKLMTISSGPFTLDPVDIHTIDAAFVFARESDDGIEDNLPTALRDRMIEARQFFNQYLIDCHNQSIPLLMKESNVDSKIHLFPNPADDILYISSSSKNYKSTIDIFEVSGQLVKSALLNQGNSQIDISALTAGVYAVVVREANEISTTKLVVH